MSALSGDDCGFQVFGKLFLGRKEGWGEGVVHEWERGCVWLERSMERLHRIKGKERRGGEEVGEVWGRGQSTSPPSSQVVT